METVKIERLVHGGQGLATLADGRRVFVWNALPGETVNIRIIKSKHSYAEAIAEEVVEPAADRVEPREANYLATSPWQIMTFAAENQAKRDIVEELFAHEKINLPALNDVKAGTKEWSYRNKMEYSFWGDEAGLHLALHQRGSHGKEIVTGSVLALPGLDEAAQAVLATLQAIPDLRAAELKSLIVRVSQTGAAVAALFVKTEKFPELALPSGLQGLEVYYSDRRSPASVTTKLLQTKGDIVLTDELLGHPFKHDVDSFFQANLPVFEQALTVIKDELEPGAVTDMYSGTGAIGLSVAQGEVDLVELDDACAAMAELNAAASGLKAQVITTSTEKALEYILADRPVIFDPPRAGLHSDVVERVLAVKPPQVIYLSCNPATQARDLALLQTAYQIKRFEIFNFFPKTPHIETLAILMPLDYNKS